jgi:hypothetical protein
MAPHVMAPTQCLCVSCLWMRRKQDRLFFGGVPICAPLFAVFVCAIVNRTDVNDLLFPAAGASMPAMLTLLAGVAGPYK